MRTWVSPPPTASYRASRNGIRNIAAVAWPQAMTTCSRVIPSSAAPMAPIRCSPETTASLYISPAGVSRTPR